jgi:two-component system chemotaxis sensor kinase CheA
MAEMSNESANAAAGIDLSQFFQVFFEEAGENLQSMEQMLLELDITAADDEELNAIFRCAHSVKGGAATFGFTDVAELTHQMEALLDKLRRHELMPTTQMVDVLLTAGDALKALLARHQGTGGEAPDTTDLKLTIKTLCAGGTADTAGSPKVAAAAPVAAVAAAPAVPAGTRVLELTVGALADTSLAESLVELFIEIEGLGKIEPLDAGRGADGMRRFKITTTSTDSDLLDLFTFHVPRESVTLKAITAGYGFYDGAPGAPAAEAAVEQGYGFFDEAPGAPS